MTCYHTDNASSVTADTPLEDIGSVLYDVFDFIEVRLNTPCTSTGGVALCLRVQTCRLHCLLRTREMWNTNSCLLHAP